MHSWEWQYKKGSLQGVVIERHYSEGAQNKDTVIKTEYKEGPRPQWNSEFDTERVQEATCL